MKLTKIFSRAHSANRMCYIITMWLTTLILLILLINMTACASHRPVLSIHPEINEYSPYMSTTPGLPMVAVLTKDLKGHTYRYHWIAEEGLFLKWHNEKGKGMGRIEMLGNDVLTNEHKIYWAAVDPNKEIESEAFDVILSVEESDTGKILYETRLTIEQREKGIFSVKTP